MICLQYAWTVPINALETVRSKIYSSSPFLSCDVDSLFAMTVFWFAHRKTGIASSDFQRRWSETIGLETSIGLDFFFNSCPCLVNFLLSSQAACFHRLLISLYSTGPSILSSPHRLTAMATSTSQLCCTMSHRTKRCLSHHDWECSPFSLCVVIFIHIFFKDFFLRFFFIILQFLFCRWELTSFKTQFRGDIRSYPLHSCLGAYYFCCCPL